MKSVKFAAALSLVVFGLSLGAFSKDKNEGKFTLYSPVQLGSTELKPGDYKATWEGTGADVQVKILQGKNVVATTPAKLEDRPVAQDSVSTGSANGAKTLQEVDFGGLHKALVFSNSETAQK